MKIIEKIIVQKETVSDSEYLISEILVSSGQIVNKGDIIFTMETSKADIEIEINFNGILLHNLDLGRKIYPGDLSLGNARLLRYRGCHHPWNENTSGRHRLQRTAQLNTLAHSKQLHQRFRPYPQYPKY